MTKTMYNFQNNSSQLSLQPYKGINKSNAAFMVFVTAAVATVWFLPYFNYDTKLIALALGCIFLFYFLYDLLIRSRIKIIFDKEKRKVYKSFGGLLKTRLYHFDDVRILNTSECSGNYYGIAHRRNRYGRNHAISGGFARKQEQEQFELQILPQIYKTLGQ